MKDTAKPQSIYQLHGFANRHAYLEVLCQEYPRSAVMMLASQLGAIEDFDGLISELEDMMDIMDTDDLE